MPLNNLNRQVLLHYLLIVLFALLVTGSIWQVGVPSGIDSWQHFQFAEAVRSELSDGNIYIQNEPGVNRGMGGFALRFYPPLTYYLMNFFYVLTGDWYVAVFFFFWFVMALSGAGIYLLARATGCLSANISLLAAFLYISEPYHNAQIHLSQAYAEFFAGALLTFCLLFITRLTTNIEQSPGEEDKLLAPASSSCLFASARFDLAGWLKRRGGQIAGLGFFYAALLLTHVPVGMLGTIALGIFAVCRLLAVRHKRTIAGNAGCLAAGFLLGAGAAGFHWARIVTEMKWIMLGTPRFLTTGAFTYDSYFVDRKNMFMPTDLMFMLLLCLLLPSVLLVITQKGNKFRRNWRRWQAVIILAAMPLFMVTSLSNFIWLLLPFLQKIQFPWRWLTIASIGASLLIAAGCAALLALLKDRLIVPALWLCVCLGVNIIFTANYVISANYYDIEYLLDNADAVNRLVASSHDKIYPTVFQTVWTTDDAFLPHSQVAVPEGRTADITKWERSEKRFTVSPGAPGTVVADLFYYPLLVAEVNGQPAAVAPDAGGRMAIDLPEGASVVRIFFQESPAVKAAIALAAISWLGIFALGVFSLSGPSIMRRQKEIMGQRQQHHHHGSGGGGSGSHTAVVPNDSENDPTDVRIK